MALHKPGTERFDYTPETQQDSFETRSREVKNQLEGLFKQRKYFVLGQRIVNELADINRNPSFAKYMIKEPWFRNFIYENIFLVMPLLDNLKVFYIERKDVIDAESDEHDYVGEDKETQKVTQNWLWKIENARGILNMIIKQETSKLNS